MIEENEIIICKDCGKSFPFTVSEQKFYAEKGFALPKRCKFCRDIRKNNKNNKNK